MSRPIAFASGQGHRGRPTEKTQTRRDVSPSRPFKLHRWADAEILTVLLGGSTQRGAGAEIGKHARLTINKATLIVPKISLRSPIETSR
jgi:hypothetical protein